MKNFILSCCVVGVSFVVNLYIGHNKKEVE